MQQRFLFYQNYLQCQRKGQHITKGKITIGFDHRKGYNKIIKEIYKCNEYTQEARGEISMIKILIKKIKFDTNIQLIKNRNALEQVRLR